MSQGITLKTTSMFSRPDQTPEKMVVMLHGYGANAQDLITLSQCWRGLSFGVEFIAPNAPYPCEASSIGYQWFSLRDYNADRFIREATASVKILKEAVEKALVARGLKWSDVVIMGFSQGGLMAALLGLSLEESPAGILSYSGALIGVDRIPIRSRPPVCLVHGDADYVVEFEISEVAHDVFKAQGVDVVLHRCVDLDHGIDDEGIQIGFDFMNACFNR